MKKLFVPVLAALITISLAACSAATPPVMEETARYGALNNAVGQSLKGETDAAAAPEAGPAPLEKEKDSSSGASGGEFNTFAADPAQKVIFYAGFTIESLDFDAAMNTLDRLTSEFGGYIESSSITGGGLYPVASGFEQRARPRQASVSLRIPSRRFGEFISRGAEIGSVVSSSTGSENVTDVYFDSESRLKSLRVKEERLLAILGKTEQLSDVVLLEQELSNTRYEIERLTGELRKYDSLIAYSTVTVEISEVKELTPEPAATLSERISLRFIASAASAKRFLENLVIWLLGDSIQILSFLLFAVIAALAGRYFYRRRKKSVTPPALQNSADRPHAEENAGNGNGGSPSEK